VKLTIASNQLYEPIYLFKIIKKILICVRLIAMFSIAEDVAKQTTVSTCLTAISQDNLGKLVLDCLHSVFYYS